MSIQEVPTVYPSEDEFKNPIAYLSSPEISGLGRKYGMIKLVPPPDFKPPLSINKHRFSFIPRIQKLNELNLLNRCRLFFFKQLLNYNTMNELPEPNDTFLVINNVKLYYYDVFITIVKILNRENNSKGKDLPDISTKTLLKNHKLWNELSITFKVPIQQLLTNFHKNVKDYFTFLSEKSEFRSTILEEKYPSSLLFDNSSEDSDDEDDEGCLICKKNDNPGKQLLCDSCDKPYHLYCLSPPLSKIPENNWYCDNCMIGNGHYGFKDSSFSYSLKDFKDLSNDFDKDFFKNQQKPNIIEMEKIFWNLVDNIDIDIKINYGADIHHSRKGEVSGFPTKDYFTSNKGTVSRSEYYEYANHPMNLNNLPFDKNSLLNYLQCDISGMTIPWIYVGNTFSTFCWHVEDQYTLSANYQHFGDIKRWYSIPSFDADKFEQFMQNLAPDLFAKQPDILHQLITLVSPFKLKENGINCYSANQNPGEYIITYPRVYHAGFNAGYNFNEAVNFTMTEWLDFGVLATKNYKKGYKKSSVFDIWDLMINVLKNYKDELQNDPILIGKILSYLKPKLNDEYSLRETVEEILDKPKQDFKISDDSVNYDISKEEKENQQDGYICSKCKGFCTFSYVKHFGPLNNDDRQIKMKNYLATPTSPNTTDEDDHRRSKRLKIKNDNETYEVQILCLDDYLKVKPNVGTDVFYSIGSLDEVKLLVQDCDLKFQHQLKEQK